MARSGDWVYALLGSFGVWKVGGREIGLKAVRGEGVSETERETRCWVGGEVLV